ncbi:MAG: MGMT family protein [Acidobacteria bacterium]|nr:MGMT family protein [Acidobacteriota bacterium]
MRGNLVYYMMRSTQGRGATRAGRGAFSRIHRLIREIPQGSVRSYGEIAAAARVSVRTVVWALRRCPEDIPWHRVVGKQGGILLARRWPLLAAEQAFRLAREGWRIRGWKIAKGGHTTRKLR